MIKIENVSFKNKKQQQILKGINLEINQGDFISVVGNNGSGKTTFFKILAKLEKCSNGEIKYLNNESIGMIFQNPNNQLFSSIVANDIAFGLENINTPKNKFDEIIDKVLNDLNIMHLKKRNVNTLSGGEIQRVAIASILALNYDVIIFDESTSMLDAKNSFILMKLMEELNKKHQKTIIFITHQWYDIKFSKKVFYFQKLLPVEIYETQEFLENNYATYRKRNLLQNL